VPLKTAGEALAADLASECSLSDASSSVTALLTPTFGDPNTMDVVDGVDPLTSTTLSALPGITTDPTVKYNPANKRASGSAYEQPAEPDVYP
jgi:hypothetical protein